MMPKGPPVPTGICPHCLFAWSNKPPQRLTAKERVRVHETISAVPNRLPVSVRQRLLKALSEGDATGLEEYFSKICDAALRGDMSARRTPRFTLHVTKDSPDELKEERELVALLPKMLEARRAGQTEPLPPGSGNRRMGALFTAADLTRKGHLPAAEYFLRWVMTADEKTLERYDYAVERNLHALATLPQAQWPPVDYTKARVPLISDCLRYIHTDSPVPDSLKRRIASRRWNALSDIALTACTAQGDRTVAPILAKRLARERDPLPADAVAAYYQKTGTPGDIPLLERYAQRLYPDAGKEPDDWLGMVRQDVESAIQTIRMKSLLAGSSE